MLQRLPSRRFFWFLGVTAPIFIAILLSAFSTPKITWITAICLTLVSVCAVMDLTTGTIPNWVTYPAVVWGLLINAVPSISSAFAIGAAANHLPVGSVGIVSSILGILLCFVVMLIGYLLAGSGAGDVKLAAALGALLGWRIALQCMMATFIIAGAVMFITLIWTKGPATVFRALYGATLCKLIPHAVPPYKVAEVQLLESPVPLGGFFACGTWFILCGGGSTFF